MDINESNLFESEERILKTAWEIINSNVYESSPLLEKYAGLTKDFEKLLGEFKKTVKISDGQQQYLQSIQEDLRKEIDEREKIEQKLEKLAATDSLTGVYNRGIGFIMLDEHLKHIKRSKEIFSVCFIDVDKLKEVNDSFGHHEGDQLIKLICDAFRDIIRECDTICRLGGDEFLITLSCCSMEEAEEIMHRVTTSPRYIKGRRNKPYDISFSYGIIEVDSNSKYSADEIIAMADKRMYQHKQRFIDGNEKR